MMVSISNERYLFNGTMWQMTIDLKYICTHAGKREYIKDKNIVRPCVPVTMARAKKLLRLIKVYTYHDPELQKDIRKYIKAYPKMLKIWEGLP